MTGCASNRLAADIVLPPTPSREYIDPSPMRLAFQSAVNGVQYGDPATAQDGIVEMSREIAKIINYYEHLVQQWEAWGYTVKKEVENGGVEKH